MSLTFTPEAIRRFRVRQRVEDSRVVYLSTRLERQEQLADEWRRSKGYVRDPIITGFGGIIAAFGLGGIAGYAWTKHADATLKEEGQEHDGQ